MRCGRQYLSETPTPVRFYGWLHPESTAFEETMPRLRRCGLPGVGTQPLRAGLACGAPTALVWCGRASGVNLRDGKRNICWAPGKEALMLMLYA